MSVILAIIVTAHILRARLFQTPLQPSKNIVKTPETANFPAKYEQLLKEYACSLNSDADKISADNSDVITREEATDTDLAPLRGEAEQNLPVSPDNSLLPESLDVDGGILFFASPLRQNP